MVTTAWDFAEFVDPRKATDVTGFLQIRWQRPRIGMTKINVDGSYSGTTNLMYTGGILRSNKGEWIQVFPRKRAREILFLQNC